MEKYDSYKDSGVEWIGEIPIHWSLGKFNFYIELKHGHQFRDNDFTDEGIPIVKMSQLNKNGKLNLNNCSTISSERLQEFNDNIINNGDILMSLTGSIGDVVRVEGLSTIILQNYRVGNFIPKTKNILKSYVFYLLKSSLMYNQYQYYKRETIQSNIGIDDFRRIYFPLTPIDEQQQIVSFLDTKTSLIDSLIEKTQNKIELLKEKRTSLINEVVTKGLNPNVEMKDSGVEWIGEIPKGWETRKLKHISDVRPSNVDKHIYEEEIQVYLCNYTDVYYNEVINSNTNLKRGSCNENEYEKFKLEKGDVIITKDSETPNDIGIPVYVEETLKNVVCGYHLTMIKPISLMGKFIFRFIECDRTRRYFELNSNGVTRFGLGKSSIENLVLPIPSETEQQQIVEYLDEQTRLIDNTTSIEEKRIELLKEYRQSLISEVVTGKRKVVE